MDHLHNQGKEEKEEAATHGASHGRRLAQAPEQLYRALLQRNDNRLQSNDEKLCCLSHLINGVCA